MNIAAHLPRVAAENPDGIAVISGGAQLTFRELDELSGRYAQGMVRYGIGRGKRTLVMVRAGVELIAVSYALFKAGAVPVLIDPGMGRKAFLKCVEDLAPTSMVGIPLAHVARIAFPSSFSSVKRFVTVGTRWFWGGANLATFAQEPTPLLTAMEPSDEAAILFTSGSTGPAKGVLYTHGIFNAQLDALRDLYGFQPGEVDLAAFPLFSLFDNALGMTSVIPELDPSRPATCDPAKIVAALRDNRCTTAFGSPAIWKRVVPWCEKHGVKLPGVKRVIIAGASVPPLLIAQLRALIGGDVYTPYGATEALPVAAIAGTTIVEETASRTTSGAGTCVGEPVINVRIIPITDAPVSETIAVPGGHIGEICVRGPVVTETYMNRPEATAAAKIRDGGDIWHRMGDVGYLDERGRLWFCGRKSERVLTAQGPIFTDPVEGICNAQGARTALVGVGRPGEQRPVLVVEGSPDPELAARLKPLAKVDAVLFHPSFPVDVRHNAKIHRLALGQWAAEQLA